MRPSRSAGLSPDGVDAGRHLVRPRDRYLIDVTPIAALATAVQLVGLAGVPTLQVTGTIVGTANTDVFLRIRSAGQAIDLPNAATTAGSLEFAQDLSALTAAGTW